MRPDLIHIKSDKREPFGSIIKIKIDDNKSHGDKLHFSVKLLKQTTDYKKEFVQFCADLKKEFDGGARSTGNVHNNCINFHHYSRKKLDIKTKILEKKISKIKSRINSKTVSVILDWKYMPPSEFLESHKKLDTDITKQLCYEFALQQLQPKNEMESQFVIPFFDKKIADDDIGSFMGKKEIYGRLRENKIQVFKANFKKIQEVYLNHDQ